MFFASRHTAPAPLSADGGAATRPSQRSSRCSAASPMGAVAAARRTQSAFPALLRRTNASDLRLGTAIYNPALGFDTGYDGPLINRLAHLPHVTRVQSAALLDVVPFLGP